MKLRNKKTGEIFDWREDTMPYGLGLPHPKSLAELNEEWEDYKPAEPLIKDENIRKAVRAWAEANEFKRDYKVKYCWSSNTLTSWQADIEFNGNIEDLEGGKEYTIAELCGEEE